MRLLLFLLFSTIEFGSAIALTFSIFLFPIRSNLSRIAFSSLFLAQTSYLIRVELDAETYAPIILVAIMFLFIWMILRVQFFYAAIMTVIGYIATAVVQFSLFLIYSKIFNLFTLELSISNHLFSYFMQASSSSLSLLICYYFVKKRIGFTFVPDDMKTIQFRRENFPFVFIIFIALIILSTFYYLRDSYSTHFIVLGLLLTLTLIMLLYLAIRKEGQHD